MKWKVLLPVLLSIIALSYPLFDFRAGWENPIEIAFRNKYVVIQFDYMGESDQVLGISAGVYSDAVNIFAAGFVSGDIINKINNGIDFESISTPVPISAALKLGNVIILAARVEGYYSSEGGFSLRDGPIPIAVGLGGRSQRGLTTSSGAIYYLTSKFAKIKNGEFKTSEDFDFKDGFVGIYGKSVGVNSEFVLDLRIKLDVIDSLDKEGFNPLNYLYVKASLSNGGFLIGGSYSPDSYSIFAGLDLNILKAWVETEKTSDRELFDNYTVSAQISF